MRNSNELNLLSDIGKTWLIDLDGTIVTHNAYLSTGDELLPGAQEFWSKISIKDIIIITTARSDSYRKSTENFLREKGLNFHYLIMNLPKGERILINDMKPDNTSTAHAINLIRDNGLQSINLTYI